MKKPRISLIALGGTISAIPGGDGPSVPTLRGTDLLEAVPDAADLAEIVEVPSAKFGGHALGLADLSSVAHLVQAEAETGADGIVITQGTDTLEEMAYALALQVKVGIPVVVTGAMRPAREAGADGPANLLAALRVAAHPDVAGAGPVVVIQDEIHAARSVTKLHTSRVAAFGSPAGGPIGEVIEAEVRLRSGAPPVDLLGLPRKLEHSVEIMWTSVGCGPAMAEAAVSAADGVVVAAMGGGHVPPPVVPILAAASKSGTPVILASRCLTGPVLTQTYGGPGTEVDLLGRGLIPAGALSPLKARLRLLVALGLKLNPAEVFPAA
jgi:L-asparaginase